VLVLVRTRGTQNCAAVTFTSLAANHTAGVDLNSDGTVVFLVWTLQSCHDELLCLVNLRVGNHLFGEFI